MEEVVIAQHKNNSQSEDEPERSLLDQSLYMMKSLLPKILNSPLNLLNYLTPPPKPSPTIMAPIQPSLLLLRPFPLSSHCLNTKKKNPQTNQLFIKMTMHLPDKMLPICTHTKLKQTSLSIVRHFSKLETPTPSFIKNKPQAHLVPVFLSIFSFLIYTLYFPFIIFDFLFDFLVP